MSSRAFHNKSRHGCGQCKKRRVKCDLRPPTCQNCARRLERCDYQDSYTTKDTTKNPSPSSIQLSGHSDLKIQSHISASGWHGFEFSPGVLLSFFEGSKITQEWDLEIIKETQQHAFLQHSFLALLVLYDQRGSAPKRDRGYIAACSHHVEATRDFRHSTMVATGQNWIAPLVFSMTVIIFQLRSAAIQPDAHSMVEIMHVLRNGARFGSSIAPGFTRARKAMNARLLGPLEPVDKETSEAIESLEHFVTGAEMKGPSQDINSQAVRALRSWLMMTQGRPRTWLDLLCWPASVSTAYIDLLAQNQPLAVVIFLHWCAVMASARKRWFLEGWPAQVARQASGTLNPSWGPRLVRVNDVLGSEGE